MFCNRGRAASKKGHEQVVKGPRKSKAATAPDAKAELPTEVPQFISLQGRCFNLGILDFKMILISNDKSVI